MSDFAKEVFPVNIEDEMRQSYMDYAMSVIVGRALPDIRDGLKPVHRRVIYAMHESGLDWNKPYKKSARIVGEVLGKYHPHGDTAVYDTIVRMAQDFSLRYRLVDGQGNFGSIDGDSAAAMRYTEVRMSKIAHQLLADIEKQTVDFEENYDGSEQEPSVLPTRVPNLLINGASGIAVGMATNIPPHNLQEVIQGCLALIDNPDLSITELMDYIPGPDFPTQGIINGVAGIKQAYQTGRGSIKIRARAEIKENNNKTQIIVHELPYQVNKARLLEHIANLVKAKKIEGISELRDESDKDGMRIVMNLRRGVVADVLLNNLYQQTALQKGFGINIVALVDGRPQVLNIKQLLEAFIRHRREVVYRRTLFDLRKARERAHILEGLAIALANIDTVITAIRQSSSPQEAKKQLMETTWQAKNIVALVQKANTEDMTVDARLPNLPAHYGLQGDIYQLSDMQAQAILDLRLHRITALEQDKILEEYQEKLIEIVEYLVILDSRSHLMQVIRDELQAITEQFGDTRRTEISISHDELNVEDLISNDLMVVTLSHEGYVKSQLLSDYSAQKRGGKGKSATAMKEADFIDKLFTANAHDTLLYFSNYGKVYWKKVYQIPQASRNARGRPIINLLPLAEGEKINAVLPVKEYDDKKFILMATTSGMIKKTPLSAYSRPQVNGIIAVNLRAGDKLVNVAITDGQQDIMLFTSAGKAIRFDEQQARISGRKAIGVKGVNLDKNQSVISMLAISKESNDQVLTVTENGYGKRTCIEEYRFTKRGGKGVLAIKPSVRNGAVVGATLVNEDDEIMLISNAGTLVRTRVKEVPAISRVSQGVRLIRLHKDEHLVGIERIEDMNEADNDDDQA